MKTPFELWLDKQAVHQLPQSLFRESVVCYKAGAYRSAMIMSYLALQNIIRQRVLQASKPSNIDEHKWHSYLSGLRNDDKWDETALNTVQAEAEKNTTFNLSKDLREQYMYWKNRRNDAAHTKNNEINQSHVEMFWVFVMSNLSKFVVIGSEQEIINKIKDHFDINKTAPSKSYQYLVDEIPFAINIAKASDFFSLLDRALKSNNLALSRRISFQNNLLSIRQDIATEASVFIVSDFDLIVEILKQDHSKSSFFTEASFIRELWKKHIIDECSKPELSLLIYFINNLIPDEQVTEARNKLVNSLLHASAFQSPLQDEPEIKLELKNPIYQIIIK